MAKADDEYSNILTNVGINLVWVLESRQVFGMKTTVSVVRKSGARSMRLERVVKGFSNHRRIEILFLLREAPELSVCEIAERCQIEFKTASEHIRRMAIAGLVLKRYKGREVRHALTDSALKILKLLDGLV
ncbi:MAG: ArsR/SmtB family transcription factor [Verrucomicrobiota bacterium]